MNKNSLFNSISLCSACEVVISCISLHNLEEFSLVLDVLSTGEHLHLGLERSLEPLGLEMLMDEVWRPNFSPNHRS